MPTKKRKRNRIEAHDEVEDQSIYPPEEFKHYLTCPFPKHNPGRYLTVNNSCTRRWGFEDIGRLKYAPYLSLMAEMI